MRILISGGPGSGCTSTAKAIGERLGLPVFDSDSYFHKPSDPPFQEQYTPQERRFLLSSESGAYPCWILSGSIATWRLDSLKPTHGVFLNVPKEARLVRLMNRQRSQFGSRIDAGGEMEEEHRSFMEWATAYEERTGEGRNLTTDLAFLKRQCRSILELAGDPSLDQVVSEIIGFLADTANPGQDGNASSLRALP